MKIRNRVHQGSEWVLEKKSEKCVMSSSMGGYTWIVKRSLKDIVSCRGVWGSSPKKIWIQGPQMVHSNTFWVILPKKNSLQIYTDLKNGPGSWKKVWNQTKVWRFCPLVLVHVNWQRHVVYCTEININLLFYNVERILFTSVSTVFFLIYRMPIMTQLLNSMMFLRVKGTFLRERLRIGCNYSPMIK